MQRSTAAAAAGARAEGAVLRGQQVRVVGTATGVADLTEPLAKIVDHFCVKLMPGEISVN